MLNDLLRKLLGKQQSADAEKGALAGITLPLTSEQFEGLLRDVARTQDVEITCDSTFELIDEYTDMVARGENASSSMPSVRQHIDLCPECQEEYELLLQVVEALVADNG